MHSSNYIYLFKKYFTQKTFSFIFSKSNKSNITKHDFFALNLCSCLSQTFLTAEAELSPDVILLSLIVTCFSVVKDCIKSSV